MEDKVIICIGTVGRPTFKKCYGIIDKFFKNHKNVKKIEIIRNKMPRSEWLNRMSELSVDYDWCLQVDEDMYLYPDALDKLLNFAIDNKKNGVKICNASCMLKDLFLNEKIGSLKIWNTDVFKYVKFKNVLGSDREFFKDALNFGFKNISIDNILADHDSAPTPEIAYKKYYEYIKKINNFNGYDSAKNFINTLEKINIKKNNNITKMALKGAIDGLGEFEKNIKYRNNNLYNKNTLNYYFDKIFYINLSSRKDRMKNMEQRLAYNGIIAERFDAINGKSNNIIDIYNNILNKKTIYDIELGRKALCSPGALGCLMSVMNIIKKAKKLNLNKILLLDDDILFSKNFNIDISKINSIPNDWKLIYFGASQHNWNNIEDYNNDFYYAKNTSGTFAVGIDSSIFDEILSITKKLELPIDSYFEKYIQTKYYKKCFVFKKNLIIADVRDSDIRESKDLQKRASLMRWDLNEYDFENFNIKKIAIAVTTYNRKKYLTDFIDSFLKTKNPYFNWTLIIADDGSTDGTVEYISGLNIKNLNIIKIFENRVGVHKQTNNIFNIVKQNSFDFCFKADDDIFFDKIGWDSLYVRSSIKSNFYHLVYYNKEWKKEIFNYKNKNLEIESNTDIDNCMGCFWTFNNLILNKIGTFDCKNFGFRGQGHIDYTARCCRLGFNNIEKIYDSLNSNEYIKMQNRKNYIDTFSKNDKDQVISRTDEEKNRKNILIKNNKRIYICE